MSNNELADARTIAATRRARRYRPLTISVWDYGLTEVTGTMERYYSSEVDHGLPRVMWLLAADCRVGRHGVTSTGTSVSHHYMDN